MSSDTEFAEELADRYTNAHFGPRSGYVGPPIAGRQRHECMVKLVQEISKTHAVTADEVVAAMGRNRFGVDLAETLSFALLFVCAAVLISRRIWARYPPAEFGAAGILICLLCGIGFGVAALLIGPQWAMVAENIRIGTGHLGSRVERLPMEHYPISVLATGVAVFWTIALVYRMCFLKIESRPSSAA